MKGKLSFNQDHAWQVLLMFWFRKEVRDLLHLTHWNLETAKTPSAMPSPEELSGAIMAPIRDQGEKGEVCRAALRAFTNFTQMREALRFNFPDKKVTEALAEKWIVLQLILRRIAEDMPFSSEEYGQEKIPELVYATEAFFDEVRKVFENSEGAHKRTDLQELPASRLLDPTQNQLEEKPLRKVGRNDPCPCGSGKKYKKFCLGS